MNISHRHVYTSWITALALQLLPVLTAFGQVSLQPLDKMAVVFEGNYSKEQIRARLDRAMELYGLPNSSENYSRAASTLVTLRKEIGPREMDILDYMIRSYVPGIAIDFPKAAALAAWALASGAR